MNSSNPMLKEEAFNERSTGLTEAMSVQGTINKTILLSALLVLAAAYSWSQAADKVNGNQLIVTGCLVVAPIVGFILAIVTAFKKEWSPITSILYSAAQGLWLGVVSLFFEGSYKGIVSQAVLCTLSTLFAMLFCYRTGLIKVTEKFRSIVFIATASIGLLYLVSFALSFFNIQVPFIHQGGMFGIGFSLVVVGVAALNLLLDFDFIERMSNSGRAPKYMEWYGAFGIMVTMVWLYLEFLRLLSKLRGRR